MAAMSTRGMIEFLEIDRDGCMHLLAAASGGLGRIAFSMPGSRVSIRPVNYAFDEPTQSVVFRSALGSRLLAALSSGPGTFEIDGGDPVERTGWSVIIAGQSEEVTDPAEIERLEAFGLEPWAPGLKAHWVRIRATSISGRRIVRVFDAKLG
jgi:nitroimidazol reductase NimA-like FMN-containing flavoprotein (pyridoxamine 5'-phosphate oxidase superfamily)